MHEHYELKCMFTYIQKIDKYNEDNYEFSNYQFIEVIMDFLGLKRI